MTDTVSTWAGTGVVRRLTEIILSWPRLLTRDHCSTWAHTLGGSAGHRSLREWRGWGRRRSTDHSTGGVAGHHSTLLSSLGVVTLRAAVSPLQIILVTAAIIDNVTLTSHHDHMILTWSDPALDCSPTLSCWSWQSHSHPLSCVQELRAETYHCHHHCHD